MKAIKVELVLVDTPEIEYILTQMLMDLKKKVGVKQAVWNKCEYFDK